MTSLEDRERAAEARFAHGQDRLFSVRATRDRLTGLWAAELLGKSDAEAAEYAREIVSEGLSGQAEEGVIRRLARDLLGHASPREIRSRMAACLHRAEADS